MIDKATKKQVKVSKDGTAGPYIILPEEQVKTVCSTLSKNGVSHWVDDEAVSLDGEPAVATVNLAYKADPSLVQALLDAQP